MADLDLDSLAAKLAKSLGRSKSDGDDDDDLDGYGRRGIPRERLNREIEKRRAAEAALAEVAQDFSAYKAATAARVEELKGQAAEQVGAIANRHQEDLSLLELGVRDDLGRKTLRMAYDALPKADRPKSVVDYFRGVTEAHAAHLADPEKAPAPVVPPVLTPYLPAKAQQGGQRQAPPPRGADAPPKAFDPSSLPVTGDMDAFFAELQKQSRLVGGGS